MKLKIWIWNQNILSAGNYGWNSYSSDGCRLCVEIAVTAVTPIATNALPMRILDSDGSFESDGTTAK